MMPNTVTEAYRVISEGILKGFHRLGLEAYFAVPETTEERELLKSPHSAVCFDAPSWYELVVEGRKVAGSAQTRQKGVILQHGSILLDIDEDKLFSLFKYSNERVMERMKKSFKNKAVAINDLTSNRISIEEAKEAFKKGFEEGLNINLEPYELNQTEIDYVNQIAKNVMKAMSGILCDNSDLHFACSSFRKRKNRNFSSIIIASLELRRNLSNFPENPTYTLLFSYFYFLLFLTK